jgi:hypothetical protein
VIIAKKTGKSKHFLELFPVFFCFFGDHQFLVEKAVFLHKILEINLVFSAAVLLTFMFYAKYF